MKKNLFILPLLTIFLCSCAKQDGYTCETHIPFYLEINLNYSLNQNKYQYSYIHGVSTIEENKYQVYYIEQTKKADDSLVSFIAFNKDLEMAFNNNSSWKVYFKENGSEEWTNSRAGFSSALNTVLNSLKKADGVFLPNKDQISYTDKYITYLINEKEAITISNDEYSICIVYNFETLSTKVTKYVNDVDVVNSDIATNINPILSTLITNE